MLRTPAPFIGALDVMSSDIALPMVSAFVRAYATAQGNTGDTTSNEMSCATLPIWMC